MRKSKKPKKFFAREYRTLGEVPRWSIVRLNKEQSVLEHTGLVAMYTLDICEILNYQWNTKPIDVRAALKWALHHDYPEVVSGDIPSPVKKMISTKEGIAEFEERIFNNRFGIYTPELPEYIENIVKTADLLEAVLKLTSELARGNRTVMGVLPGLTELLFDHAARSFVDQPTCKELKNELVAAISDEFHGTDGVGGLKGADKFWNELLKYEKFFNPGSV